MFNIPRKTTGQDLFVFKTGARHFITLALQKTHDLAIQNIQNPKTYHFSQETLRWLEMHGKTAIDQIRNFLTDSIFLEVFFEACKAFELVEPRNSAQYINPMVVTQLSNMLEDPDTYCFQIDITEKLIADLRGSSKSKQQIILIESLNKNEVDHLLSFLDACGRNDLTEQFLINQHPAYDFLGRLATLLFQEMSRYPSRTIDFSSILERMRQLGLKYGLLLLTPHIREYTKEKEKLSQQGFCLEALDYEDRATSGVITLHGMLNHLLQCDMNLLNDQIEIFINNTASIYTIEKTVHNHLSRWLFRKANWILANIVGLSRPRGNFFGETYASRFNKQMLIFGDVKLVRPFTTFTTEQLEQLRDKIYPLLRETFDHEYSDFLQLVCKLGWHNDYKQKDLPFTYDLVIALDTALRPAGSNIPVLPLMDVEIINLPALAGKMPNHEKSPNLLTKICPESLDTPYTNPKIMAEILGIGAKYASNPTLQSPSNTYSRSEKTGNGKPPLQPAPSFIPKPGSSGEKNTKKTTPTGIAELALEEAKKTARHSNQSRLPNRKGRTLGHSQHKQYYAKTQAPYFRPASGGNIDQNKVLGQIRK